MTLRAESNLIVTEHYLTCIHPDQNRYRFYHMTMQLGLFSKLCLIRRWGRIGNEGRRLSMSFETMDELNREVQRLLRMKERKGYSRSPA
jgi:predicted DNA-binding WGR domain protein